MDEEAIKESAISDIFHKHLGANPHISKNKIEHCVTYISTLLSNEPIDLELFSKIQEAIDDLIQFFNETVYSEDTIAKNNREYCKKILRNRSNPVSTRTVLQGKFYVRNQMRALRTELKEALEKVKDEIEDLITVATPATVDLEGSQASAAYRDPVSLPYQDELNTPARKKKQRKRPNRREQLDNYLTPSTAEEMTASLQALSIAEENTSYSTLGDQGRSVRKKERAAKKVTIPVQEKYSFQDVIPNSLFQSTYNPLSDEKSDPEEVSGSAYRRWQPAKLGWEESYRSILSASSSLVQDDRGERDNCFTPISTMAASLQTLNIVEKNTSCSTLYSDDPNAKKERALAVQRRKRATKKVIQPHQEKYSSEDVFTASFFQPKDNLIFKECATKRKPLYQEKYPTQYEIPDNFFQSKDNSIKESDLEEASGSTYPTWQPS